MSGDFQSENPTPEPRTIRELLDVMDLCEEFETRWALEELVQRREEAVPEILRDIEKVRDIPEGVPVILGDRWFFEVLLLAQFREKRAVPILVSQFSQDSNHIDLLFDAFLTEDLPRVLASVCMADIEPLKGLVENRHVNEWVRSAAMAAMGHLVKEDVLPKSELEAYLGGLFDGKLEREVSVVWNEWASLIADFQLAELLPEAKQAFRAGWVESMYMSLEELEEDLRKGPGVPLAQNTTFCRGFVCDVFEEMKGWEWAYPEEDPPFAENHEPVFPSLDRPAIGHERPGRNAHCPCGSGKKYKKCCGR